MLSIRFTKISHYVKDGFADMADILLDIPVGVWNNMHVWLDTEVVFSMFRNV